MCLNMIYLTCIICGYAIDIMQDDEVNNPVRAKRLKYLTTRDQICPNCVNTIGKCERVDSPEENIPILRVDVADDTKTGLIKFCRDNGYVVATKYTLDEYMKVKA